MREQAIGSLMVTALWLCACEPVRHPAVATAASVLPPPSAVTLTTTGSEDAACAYTWASRELPDLSASLQNSLLVLNPKTTASAYAYGEDCVSADGTTSFTPMETDFRVRMYVSDIKDAAHMGDLAAKSMQVIAAIPVTQLSGPKAGRADIEFYSGDSAALSVHLIVPIDDYRGIAPAIQGSELFKRFYSGP